MIYAIETVNLTKEFIPSKNLINLHSLFFQKRNSILAVDNVNLQIGSGELFGLVGPNGAGKTTLIKMLSCLILPTRGTAKVAGYSILEDEEKVESSIGLITSNERGFYWRLTGRQNLHFFATIYGLSPMQAKKKIKELSIILEIEDQLDKRFQEYSTGIKQRLSIVRGLLGDPPILFMDEPTMSLDPISSRSIKMIIKKKLVREQGKTVIFITQLLSEADELSDRLAIMDRGRIKVCGSLDVLKNSLGIPEVTIEDVFNYYTID